MNNGKSAGANSATESFSPARRNFLRATVLVGGGFTLSLSLSGCGAEESGSDDDKLSGSGAFSPSIWLTVNSDNSVILTVAEAEMGQGVLTALPMLIAEEMDLDWQQVMVRQAPVDPLFGNQQTGGSTSIRHAWQPLREAGATARQALVEAAARRWQVAPQECCTRNGRVFGTKEGDEATYGELAVLAAQAPLPVNAVLKLPQDYRILGRPQRRTDLLAKTSGKAMFGIDAMVSGMRVAVIAGPPRLGEVVSKVDSQRALAVPGVVDVINLITGVAVIAEGFWQAEQGRRALDLSWRAATPIVDSSQIEMQMINQLGSDEAEVVWSQGAGVDLDLDVEQPGVVEAVYRLPLQAHATMEPMNCSAWFHHGICEVWAPTQAATRARDVAADLAVGSLERAWQKVELRLTGKRHDPVLVHTTLMGGGFGRRAEVDYVEQVVSIARQVSYPVKLIYSRGDDFAGDYFRPPSVQRMRARLSAKGLPLQWHHRLVSNSKSASGAKPITYDIPEALVDVHLVDTPHLRQGYWRSVAHSYTAFAVESFIDELAHYAGIDSLAYRLQLLPNGSRISKVLKSVAQMAGWHNSESNRYLGIAGHYAFGSYTAQVVELVDQPGGELRLTRVYCAFDCGQVIDPDMVQAQLQGSIVYALTAALKSHITVKDGVVGQRDFAGFPLLSFAETPEIIVQLVDSHATPGGAGEPGVPPLLPALANALFVATGERYRSFPVEGLALSSGPA